MNKLVRYIDLPNVIQSNWFKLLLLRTTSGGTSVESQLNVNDIRVTVYYVQLRSYAVTVNRVTTSTVKKGTRIIKKSNKKKMVEHVRPGIIKLMFDAFENGKPLPEKPILQVMKVGLTNPSNQNSSQQRYRSA